MTDADQALGELTSQLSDALGPDLVGVALYGGLAKGRFTPGISDINVLVLLTRADFDTLAKAAPPLIAARRSHRISTLVLTPHELQQMADVFPVKVADIKATHRVLHGRVRFSDVEVDLGALQLRVRQQLTNMSLRARAAAIAEPNDADALWRQIVQTLPKLAVTLETVLRIPGLAVPTDRPGLLRRASEAMEVPDLARFADLHRHRERPSDEEVRSLMKDWLGLFDQLIAAVDRFLQ